MSNGNKKNAPDRTKTIRGLMHHWRTVGLAIPHRVASQQSPTPLRQTMSLCRRKVSHEGIIGHQSYALKIPNLTSQGAIVGVAVPWIRRMM